MILHCQNDYGTLQVNFGQLEVFLCDAPSCQIFENLAKSLNNYGLVFDLDYFDVDTDTGIVSIFAQQSEGVNRSFIPVYTLAARKIFKVDSMLFRLYNLFAPKRKKIVLHNGNFSMGISEFASHSSLFNRDRCDSSHD